LHPLAQPLADRISANMAASATLDGGGMTPLALPSADITLDSFCIDRYGYLRLEVSAETLKGEYLAGPAAHVSQPSPAERVDAFTLDLTQHRLVS
jgi:hypothetical protein